MSAGVPQTLVFGEKPRAAQATKTRITYPSLNKATFLAGETIQIQVPTAKATYLNPAQSYLQFAVQRVETTGSVLTMDYSASGFIRQLSIRLGSSVLETISDYKVLQSMLWDSQGSRDVQYHSGNILEGMSAASEKTGLTIASTKQYFAIPLIPAS